MLLQAVRLLLTMVPSVDVAELQNADLSVNHSSQTAKFQRNKMRRLFNDSFASCLP